MLKNFFNNLNQELKLKEEANLIKSCRDFIKKSEDLTNFLIFEDDRHKKNLRWYSSKKIIQKRMVLCMMYESLIEDLIDDYVKKFGLNPKIKKIESGFKNIVSHNEKTIRPYFYLIDIKECEKELMKTIN